MKNTLAKVTVISAFICLYCREISGTSRVCVDPPNLSHRARRLSHRHSSRHELVMTYAAIASQSNQNQEDENDPLEFVVKETCPKDKPFSEHQRERSTCPWRVRWEVDPDRRPRELPQAECTCIDCSGQNFMAACEKIIYHVPVLKRTGICREDESGKLFYVWKPVYAQVATGCTCARVP